MAAAANGFPDTEAVGEGTSVMPDSGTVWLAGSVATGTGLLEVLTPGVAVGTGEAGEVAASAVGMSYFCN